SLLFVTKIGGDTHKLALAGVTAKHSLFALPANVALNFHNVGNSHVVPRGVVSILDSRGQIISKGIINQDSDIILPETYRLLNVPLVKVSSARGIGRYTLRTDFRFDGFGQYRRYQTKLWLFPPGPFVGLLALLFLAAAVVYITRWQ